MERRVTFGWMVAVVALAGCPTASGPGQDCDAPADAWVDGDGDGFGAQGTEVASMCPGTPGYADNPLDCDDADGQVHPGLEEDCNGLDDDCNGEVDNGLDGVLYFTDADGDGFGVQYPSQIGCDNPGAGWSKNDEDCDDTSDAVHPDAREVCNGSVDDDCNGLADDSDPATDASTMTLWYHDADADGFGDASDSLRRCIAPTAFVADDTDCNDGSDAVNPGADEVCDALDNDCDNRVDDADDSVDPASQTTFYADSDGDGFGDASLDVLACRAIPGLSSPNGDDCDDTDDRVSPDDPERLCDDVDNDCDVGTDDRPDGDSDGTGYCDGDCNDANGAISPTANEVPADNVDQNCDGLEACYIDADLDLARSTATIEVADALCRQAGHLTAAAPIDCDDNDPTVNVDVSWYADSDGDGYGAGSPQAFQCLDPGGGLVPASDPLDCDDADAAHSPATVEICTDAVDQNCDALVDCDDPTCGGDPACLGPCVDIGLASVVPLMTNGATNGQRDDLTPATCGYSNAADVVFQWVPPADGQYTIDTFGSNFDTVLYVTRGCGGQEIGCNDDSGGTLQSEVVVTGFAGEPLVIVVDGYATNVGNFTLNIQ